MISQAVPLHRKGCQSFQHAPQQSRYGPCSMSAELSASSDREPISIPLASPVCQYPVSQQQSLQAIYDTGDRVESRHRAHEHHVSEHMLRRKTPNGTLAAGYDGTPVQWSSKPSAPKYIVLPLSNTIPAGTSYGYSSECTNNHPSPRHVGNSAWPGVSQVLWEPIDSSPGMQIVDSSPFVDCNLPPQPVPVGSERIFNVIPSYETAPHFRHQSINTPNILQPMDQPGIGPTVSNDGDYYGSYFTEERFIQYRPTPVRDADYLNVNQLKGKCQMLPPSLGAHFRKIDDYKLTNYNTLPVSTHNFLKNGLAFHSHDQGFRQNASRPGEAEHGEFLSNNYFWPLNMDSPAINNEGRQNPRFKEKVLDWAHRAYVDLLVLLHSRRGHQQATTSIYPKPPRQQLSRSSGIAHANGVSFNGVKSLHPRHEQTNSDQYPLPRTPRRRSHPLVNVLEGKRTLGRKPSIQPLHSEQLQHNIHQHSGHIAPALAVDSSHQSAVNTAKASLEMLTNLCEESKWRWIDGMLLGGCLAYGLGDYNSALIWYSKIMSIDPHHVEAISNIGTTMLSLNRKEEAEQYWVQSVRFRPSYFEAVEHLVGLLCGGHRVKEAVGIIEYVENSLRSAVSGRGDETGYVSDVSSEEGYSSSCESYGSSDQGSLDYDADNLHKTRGLRTWPSSKTEEMKRLSGFGSSGYAIPGSDNGRILALVHAKGNMLYALGDIRGASQAFEDAVLISAGRRAHGIQGLIRRILRVLSKENGSIAHRASVFSLTSPSGTMPLLLPPDRALRTAVLVFSKHGQLPGLRFMADGAAKTSAISTTSNSLLSLAKIFQDNTSNATLSTGFTRRPSGVGDILALYYLSLALQPSPSTANNVGILLASVQQPVSLKTLPFKTSCSPAIPGVVPGSGIALALAYYNYGLNLDPSHAHLYTNLGSLLKDIGQLAAAIKMYEQAVACDGQFDIALANLANAVKDQGRISDAIDYYKRAVLSSPDFAEAVCGLSNALNSVCDWTGRGGVILDESRHDRWHVDDEGMLCDAKAAGKSAGWMKRVVNIIRRQLEDGANWGRGILKEQVLQSMLHQLELADTGGRWSHEKSATMQAKLSSWSGRSWEGARVVRLIERAVKRATHRWYSDKFLQNKILPLSTYSRPQLPSALSIPGAPTVLPFHTFTCPLTARDIRMISERNALRISCSTLQAPWLPRSVYPPPPPPRQHLNIGYVSSDFNNHPLAHLMQSVFGLHDASKAKAFCYATTASDNSVHREQIQREAPVFWDASSWSSDRLIEQILQDEIHILVNLNGYTRGARNEVFAARPAPIQMSFMGFAGTLGAEWCDYLLADEMAVPPETLRPWRRNIELEDQMVDDESSASDPDWVYSENIIFCRDTFFCCDHRQSSNDIQLPWKEEQRRRWQMRKELFPDLADDVIILGNFNQLYKIEPTTFRTWLRILSKVPRAILWLLRFPDLGESNLKRTATLWAGEEVSSRIWFTDVAPKNQHISRARVCDLFLDTPECNAHTTAADILWSSTPLLTLPRYKYKMCSRMAASILQGALPKSAEGRHAASELIMLDEDQYEDCAVRLANDLVYNSEGFGTGRLLELRKLLYESRMTSALFDTRRWVSDLEKAYAEAWRRWVEGIGGDIYL